MLIGVYLYGFTAITLMAVYGVWRDIPVLVVVAAATAGLSYLAEFIGDYRVMVNDSSTLYRLQVGVIVAALSTYVFGGLIAIGGLL